MSSRHLSIRERTRGSLGPSDRRGPLCSCSEALVTVMLRGCSASRLPESAVGVEQFSAYQLAGWGVEQSRTWRTCDSLMGSRAAQGEEGLWHPVPTSPEHSLLTLTSSKPQWPRLYNRNSGADMRGCTALDTWGQRIISLEVSIQRPGGNTTSAGLTVNLPQPCPVGTPRGGVCNSVLCLVWPKAK